MQLFCGIKPHFYQDKIDVESFDFSIKISASTTQSGNERIENSEQKIEELKEEELNSFKHDFRVRMKQQNPQKLASAGKLDQIPKIAV